MAKITAKIRVGDYSSSDNSFDIKFQLRPATENGPEFTFSFGPMLLCIPDETRFWLAGFGLSDEKIRQVQEEVLEWLHKPRARLGSTWYDLIWSRVELAIKIEKERRGKAEAERIAMEAPCLDWAMSALDELEDEPESVDRIIAIETAGLDEDTSTASSLIHPILAKKLAKMKTDHELLWHVHAANALPEPSDFEDLLYKLEDLAAKRQMLSTWHERETHPDYYETCDKVDDAREAILDHVEAMKQVPSATPAAPRSLPTAAIGKAVNVIHTHARRFLTPMSLREHDFLRSVIQEEIERVVGGVL